MIPRLVILTILVALVSSASQPVVVRQLQDIEPDGSYQYSYETENGIYVQEEGKVRSITDEGVDLVVQGSYLYTAPDGQEINVRYTADENGFRPEGSHLPTTPPTPSHILRALEWIATHPSQNQ